MKSKFLVDNFYTIPKIRVITKLPKIYFSFPISCMEIKDCLCKY